MSESCVYSYVPLEELSSENEMKIFYVSPNNNGSWTVFIKDDKVLRLANFK